VRGAPGGAETHATVVKQFRQKSHADYMAEQEQGASQKFLSSAGDFGLELSAAELCSWSPEERAARLRAALRESSGLVLVRGMHQLTPGDLVEISRALGEVVRPCRRWSPRPRMPIVLKKQGFKLHL
jgi:hypothetical protein